MREADAAMGDIPVRHDDGRGGVPIIPDPGLRRPLDRFAEQTWETYVSMARRWIPRLQIDQIGLAVEGAVQRTWVELCELIQGGRIEPPASRAEFDGVFGPLLLQVLFDERRRQRAKKRGWGMAVPLDEAARDVADARGGAPEERISSED
jgi:hypothetical protein